MDEGDTPNTKREQDHTSTGSLGEGIHNVHSFFKNFIG